MKYDVSSPMPLWYAVAQLVEALRYKPEGGGFDPRWCHWNFSLTQSFRPHCGPGVDSASNRKEYQEYFLGGKGGRCLGLTALPCPCADVLKYGSLNLLEPSGPVQACNGFALPSSPMPLDTQPDYVFGQLVHARPSLVKKYEHSKEQEEPKSKKKRNLIFLCLI